MTTVPDALAKPVTPRFFDPHTKDYVPCSAAALAHATELHLSGYISVSNKYHMVSRPRPGVDFTKYGYEWHARVEGQELTLHAETYAAFRYVAQRRCGQCGVIEDLEPHAEGCRAAAQTVQNTIDALRSKLSAAMAEIASLKKELGR